MKITDVKKITTGILSAAAIFSTFNLQALAQDYGLPPSFQDITNNAGNYSQYLDEADIYYKKGMEHFSAKEYSKAIESLKKALGLAPERSEIRVNLSAAYINKGSYFFNQETGIEQAANDYRNAIYYIYYDGHNISSKLAEENMFIAQSNLNNAVDALKIDSRLKTAKALRGQGKFTEAIVEYQEALKKERNNSGLYEEIADVYKVLQKGKLASEYYKKALALNQSKPELHLKYAKALQDSGNNEIAVKEFHIALNTSKNEQKTEILTNLESIWIEKIKNNPQDVSAHMNLGVVLQKKGDLEGAMREYKIAESISPNDITTRLNIGTLFQAQKNYTNALRAYDTILQVRPEHVLAHYYKGTALKEMNLLTEAINEFNQVLRIDARNTMAKEALFETVMLFPDKNDVFNALSAFARNNPTDADAQYKFAFHLHTLNRAEEALDYYNRTINIAPDFVDAYLNIATIYKETNQPELAISTLKTAHERIPDNKKITEMISIIDSDAATQQYNKALQMHTDGKYKEAILEYNKIIAISEPDSDLYVNLGAAHQALNNNKEAIQAYEKAVTIDTKNSTAFYYLGTVYSQQEDFDKALKNYRKAFTLDPKNETVRQAIEASKKQISSKLLEKGITEYTQGKYKESLLTLNTVLINDSTNAEAYYQRGMINDAIKKLPLAISDYALAVKYDPELSMAYYAMAADYDILKNYPEAKKWYRKFVEKSQNQDDEYVKYSKKRLSQL